MGVKLKLLHHEELSCCRPWPLLPSLSQDTDTEATAMVVDMVMEVMATEDTEVTMARDLLMLRLMLSQDTTDMEVMVLVMDMVEDITDKKLVHINQLKAINHKFYFKTDSFSQ